MELLDDEGEFVNKLQWKSWKYDGGLMTLVVLLGMVGIKGLEFNGKRVSHGNLSILLTSMYC